MTAQEILNEIEEKSTWCLSFEMIDEIIIPAMEAYGKQQYNQAIEDAVENATTECTSTCIRVYKQSILKLKK